MVAVSNRTRIDIAHENTQQIEFEHLRRLFQSILTFIIIFVFIINHRIKTCEPIILFLLYQRN